MEIYPSCKGYATRENAIKKLAKILPDYNDYAWFVVALPSGRFLPVVRLSNTDKSYMVGDVAYAEIGVM